MEEAGLTISGTSPDGKLVEIVEIKDHPYFIASQFHPEFKSRPDRPAPLFLGLIKACAQVLKRGCKTLSKTKNKSLRFFLNFYFYMGIVISIICSKFCIPVEHLIHQFFLYALDLIKSYQDQS